MRRRRLLDASIGNEVVFVDTGARKVCLNWMQALEIGNEVVFVDTGARKVCLNWMQALEMKWYLLTQEHVRYA